MARSAKKAAVSAAPQAPEIERPPQPKRYKASKDELLELYREMLLIRRFEERAGQLYGLGLIGGFCHLYIGQEAVAVGLQSAMTVGKDSVITGYRDHGHMLAYGIDPKVIMAELTGREAGISKGKGGSMHMFSVEHGFYGGHGIVGAQVPLGTGLAFKHKYAEDGGVCLAYFGDGAVNQGQVYESLQHGQAVEPAGHLRDREQQICDGHERSSARRPSRCSTGAARASAFPGIQVDGMDVLAVRGAAEVALEWTRGGKGPIIIEFMTYRYRGHSMSDPAKYRTREEVQDVREHQRPDRPCREASSRSMGVKEDELKAIDKEIKDIVVEAAKFAEEAPEPDAGRALHRRAGGELLMPIELKMPALSPTMEEGTLAKWLVKEGDDGQIGRHPGRDRDRQGDDGVRSGRRRHDRQDPGPRGHRRGEGRRSRSRCWPARASRSATAPLQRRRPKRRSRRSTEEPTVAAAGIAAGRGDADAARVRDRGARSRRRRRQDPRRAGGARGHAAGHA